MRALEQQLEDLLRQCDRNLDRIEQELPKPRVSMEKEFSRRGISRRDFIKWTSVMTTTLMLPPLFESSIARAAKNFNRLPVIWLHLAECTGCSESIVRTESPDIIQILLDSISLEYHETLMAPSGYQAERSLEDAQTTFDGKFVCVMEGALPFGNDGTFLTIGPEGKTGVQRVRETAEKAAAIISLGSCASFGNVQTAAPNPTAAKGVPDALHSLGVNKANINIPGCPPQPVSFIGTVLYFILFGKLPELDSIGRPTFAYGMSVHDTCERRDHFEAGEFARSWDDENLKNGWCLVLFGCKGPATRNICSRIRWNLHINWPVGAGHPCIGCSEIDFWDNNSPLYNLPVEETENQRIERYRSIFKRLSLPLDSPGAKRLGL